MVLFIQPQMEGMLMKFALKIFGITFFLSLSVQAQSARDSVGVFHRSDKVVVLVTERYGNGRLENFMNAVADGDTLFLKNTDESIHIRCGKSAKESSCTFRFHPSESVHIGDRNVQGILPLKTRAHSEVIFESSMGDKFILKVTEQGLQFWAGKKGSLEEYE
jgi:hypothetical protein